MKFSRWLPKRELSHKIIWLLLVMRNKPIAKINVIPKGSIKDLGNSGKFCFP